MSQCGPSDIDDVLEKHKALIKRLKAQRRRDKQQQQRDDKQCNTRAQAASLPPLPSKSAFSKRVTADEPIDPPETVSDASSSSPNFTPFNCELCSFHNRAGEACELCFHPRPAASDIESTNDAFQCAVCRRHNKSGANCSGCFAVRTDMVDAEADDEHEHDQPRTSKRQRTARQAYKPAVRLTSNTNRRLVDVKQQHQQSKANSSIEEGAGSDEHTGIASIDHTADARTLFMQTNWEALHDELECIRQEMQSEREHSAREKKIREEQLAALQTRYSWPTNVVTHPSPMPRDEVKEEKPSSKKEEINIDMDEECNAKG